MKTLVSLTMHSSQKDSVLIRKILEMKHWRRIISQGANWFPQMHIRVKPTDWLDIRLASTKSIIYPDYRAISPYMYYDSYSNPALDLGNPALSPALSQNYDIYASVYKNKIGLFTAGFFC